MNDHEGFYLMQHLIQFLPQDVLKPFMKQIFVLIFTRLQSSKTAKFIKGVIVFFCFFAARFVARSKWALNLVIWKEFHKVLFVFRYSPAELINLIDSIQAGMFAMVIERIIIQDVRKVSGQVEKKITAIGLIKLLCECDHLINGAYSQYW